MAQTLAGLDILAVVALRRAYRRGPRGRILTICGCVEGFRAYSSHSRQATFSRASILPEFRTSSSKFSRTFSSCTRIFIPVMCRKRSPISLRSSNCSRANCKTGTATPKAQRKRAILSRRPSETCLIRISRCRVLSATGPPVLNAESHAHGPGVSAPAIATS